MKPKILCFIDWFLPGYKAGGQIQSLANAIDCLHDDYEFYVVTRNTDLDGKQTYSVPFERWIAGYNAQVFYVDGSLNKKKIGGIISEIKPDIVYFSSFFSIQYTVRPLLYLKTHSIRTKKVVGPRGMLGEGALQLKSRKKKIFIAIAKLFGLYSNVIWHASNDIERDNIISIFGFQQSIRIACDIPKPVSSIAIPKKPKQNDAASFVFLSRISVKKNLLFALQQLQTIPHRVTFEIIGPIEDESYWNECNTVIASLPANISVQYRGSMTANEVVAYIAENAQFFILPTLHENFGHVIIEALSAACPVLISDQTPWRNLVSSGIGWDIALQDTESWHQALLQCCTMSNDDYQKMSAKALLFAKEFGNNPAILEENRKLFSF